MSNYQKELEKIKNNPKNVAFSKIKNILEKAGYACSNNGSSHYQFRKNGEETITIPFARPVKAIYIKMVLKALEE